MHYPDQYEEERVDSTSESGPGIRRGSTYGAAWLAKAASQLAESGASGLTIVEHLEALTMVLTDWKEGIVEMPDGPPWTWSELDLEAFIAENRDEWG